MKSKSVLKKQAIKRRKRKTFSELFRIIYVVGSYSVKSSFFLAGLITISLLFLSIYQYMLTSPYLQIKQVIVRGVDEETKSSILKMPKLNFDTTLLGVDTNEMRQNMEEHPWIRSVKLQKSFPHTLIIQAEREKPWAVVVMGELYYMNRWGKIFKRVDKNEDIDFPLITGVTKDEGEREMKLALAAHVLSALEAEKGLWALEELSEVNVNKNGNVSLYFRSLPAVVKLKGSELGIKIGDLKRVVFHLNKSGQTHRVREINLNYRDGAVVSFKNS